MWKNIRILVCNGDWEKEERQHETLERKYLLNLVKEYES